MPTDMPLPRDVLNDVRGACETTGRPTTDAEVERALASLSVPEVEAVHRLARTPLRTGPVGPEALVDMVRGTEPAVASARELGGYYAMKAERDALARLARARVAPEPAPAPVPLRPLPAPEETAGEAAPEARDPESSAEEATDDPRSEAVEPAPARRKRERVADPASFDRRGYEEAQQQLVTLFAYHRDAVRVAQELGLGMVELNERVDTLGLKRRIHRLLESTTDIEAFTPERVRTPRGEARTAPVLRKRTEKVERVVDPEPEPRPPERSVPAAWTQPVNEHGTRVYRRVEPPPQPRETPASSLVARREYVREPRRKERPPTRPVAPIEPPEPPTTPTRRPFAELQGPGGAAILERLLADEKANPRVLAARLSERFDGPAGRDVTDGDLRMLLAHHGLAATFQEREIANTRFLIGFHQGARAKLANALLLASDELAGYLGRLGLSEELERTRQERARIELGRKRLHDRIVQVLTRAPYLDDLGVLPAIDREVREQLGQLFAAKVPGATVAAALEERVREELQLEPNAFAKLLRRYELTEHAAKLLG